MPHHLEPNDVLRSADGLTSPVAVSSAGAGRIGVSMAMSPEAFEALTTLAQESGSRLDDVISKAFVLYRTAAEAHREGKAVGIAPTPDVLETEIVGF